MNGGDWIAVGEDLHAEAMDVVTGRWQRVVERARRAALAEARRTAPPQLPSLVLLRTERAAA